MISSEPCSWGWSITDWFENFVPSLHTHHGSNVEEDTVACFAENITTHNPERFGYQEGVVPSALAGSIR